jgi:hypothetical protein
MGPKKKAAKESGGGSTKAPPGGADGPKAYKISRQLDQERLDFLGKRIEDLLGSNNELRTSSSRNEKDTHDIVLYFQREMEMKDDIIARLNEELIKRETQLKFEVEKTKKRFDDEKEEIQRNADYMLVDLTNRLEKAEADLNSLVLYQQEKDKHEARVQQLERALENQRQEMFDSLDEQERKFLEENANRLRELDEQKLAFRELALKEAKDAMGEEVKKIVNDNTRMSEELKFHNVMTADLQADKTCLEKELQTAKRELSIISDKEVEYAHQGFYKAKEIRALRERVEHLEKTQAVNVEKFKHKTKALKATVHRELEEATLDAAGLRRLLKIKNKELQRMKTLAATILSQRTETEQFFLESLNEVKQLIKRDRRRTHVETKIVLNKLRSGAGTSGVGKSKKEQVTAFPPLKIKGANLHHLDARKTSEIPLGNMDNVNMKDLSWEDKELVLRVLFAKMNGSQKAVDSAVDLGTAGRTGMQPPLPLQMQMQMEEGSGNVPVFVSEGLGLMQQQQQDVNWETAFGRIGGDGDDDMNDMDGMGGEYENDGEDDGAALGGGFGLMQGSIDAM